LWIDADAPIDDPVTLKIKEGDVAWVLVDVLGQPRMRTGKVIEVAPAAHPVARTRRVRVELDNSAGADQLLAGDTAWVRFTAPPDEFVRRVTAVARGGEERP
jgi:multidrug efflux pump subunit AcrA (membrane-fusion protein)